MDQYYNDEYNYSNSDSTADFRLELEDLPRYQGKPHPKQPKNTKHVKFLDQANGYIGVNGQPMMHANGQPMMNANGQPMMNANGQPMMGSEVNGPSSVIFPMLSYSQQCSLNSQPQAKIPGPDPSCIIVLLVIIAVLLIVISIQLSVSSAKKYDWSLLSSNPPFNLVRL